VFDTADTLAGNPASESTAGTYPTDITLGAGDYPGDTGGIAYEPDADDDIESTRAQIEQTRADMSETIDAIQQKLSPQNLADQAKSTVREATVGKAEQMVDSAKQAVSSATDTAKQAVSSPVGTAKQAANITGDTARGFGSTVVETVRQNPVPAALAGVGLGWLLMSGRKQGGSQVRSRWRSDYDLPYSYDRDYTYGYQDYDQQGGAGQTARQAVSRAQDAVGSATSQAQSAVGETVSQAQDAANRVTGQVQDTAGQVATQVQDTASQLGNQAQYRTQRAASGFQQMLEERPLAVAAGALALGLTVGLALPETEQENRWMGEARETVMEQAQQTAQQTVDKVQTVAQEAMGAAKDTAQEEAQNQNLTS
jgi:ElaB/YqjD/DUF883 family membrane-anchored ribosome-binding protein